MEKHDAAVGAGSSEGGGGEGGGDGGDGDRGGRGGRDGGGGCGHCEIAPVETAMVVAYVQTVAPTSTSTSAAALTSVPMFW